MWTRFVLAACILSLTATGQVFKHVSSQGGLQFLNEPFSADAITTLARTLPDGTHITRQMMTVKMYRDSAGRSRSDIIPSKFFAGQPAPPETILIRDPIAGYWYELDTANKIARRGTYKSVGSGTPTIPLNEIPTASAPVANNARPQFKTEDLGTQTMEGLIVQGRRTTVTTPAGSIGNNRDIANVYEIWTNKELQLMILQFHSDPRNGETTTKIEILSRTQPDPNLFQPPPDYKIVDVVKSQ